MKKALFFISICMMAPLSIDAGLIRDCIVYKVGQKSVSSSSKKDIEDIKKELDEVRKENEVLKKCIERHPELQDELVKVIDNERKQEKIVTSILGGMLGGVSLGLLFWVGVVYVKENKKTRRA